MFNFFFLSVKGPQFRTIRDMSFLVRQLKVKNSVAYHFSYSAGLRILLSNVYSK